MDSRPEERRADTPSGAIDWSVVVESHRAWLERLIVARTGAEDLVPDVMQEVSVAVTQSNCRPTCPDEVAPWLCRIAVRQCALALRTRSRQQRKLDGLLRGMETRDLQTGDPISWLLHNELREIVRAELGAMDADQRQLLVWKYFHGMDYGAIGSQLGVSKHAAEYRVIEARKQLRRRLQARGIDGDESR